jgi:hypothetical protein
MLTLCDCPIPDEDIRTLIDRLERDVTLDSDEAAAALRFALETKTSAISLDPAIRDAIKDVLHEPLPIGLSELRDALASGYC